MTSSFSVPGLPEHAIETHRHIIEAIGRREPEEARRRMHSHVARVQEAVTRARSGAA